MAITNTQIALTLSQSAIQNFHLSNDPEEAGRQAALIYKTLLENLPPQKPAPERMLY